MNTKQIKNQTSVFTFALSNWSLSMSQVQTIVPVLPVSDMQHKLNYSSSKAFGIIMKVTSSPVTYFKSYEGHTNISEKNELKTRYYSLSTCSLSSYFHY